LEKVGTVIKPFDSKIRTQQYRHPFGAISQPANVKTNETTSVALGGALALAGVGLFVGLLVDSIQLVTASLFATLCLIVLSLLVMFRQEGVVTPENKLIGGFVALAMGLLFVLSWATTLPQEIIFGVVLLVGVVVPMFLLEREK